MKKSFIATIATILLLTGCTEDKKDTKVESVKQELTQNTEQKVEETKSVNEANKIENKKAETNKVVEVDLNGESLFKNCASCHGPKGDKEALGKSQLIGGWDKDRVKKALNGYKDGTYGGVMKTIMKQQIDGKTPEQIEILSEYVSQLK